MKQLNYKAIIYRIRTSKAHRVARIAMIVLCLAAVIFNVWCLANIWNEGDFARIGLGSFACVCCLSSVFFHVLGIVLDKQDT